MEIFKLVEAWCKEEIRPLLVGYMRNKQVHNKWYEEQYTVE